MPKTRWEINEADIRKRAREVDLNNLYRNAFLRWEEFYDDGYQHFGSSPVKDAYWGYSPIGSPYVWKGNIVGKKKCVKSTQIETPQIFHHFNRNLLSRPAPTMIFRRYPNLMPEIEIAYYGLDILVKSFLGFAQDFGYKTANNAYILDDAWTVNLRTIGKENIMMDSFLRGFGDDLKKQWEDKPVIAVDVSEELKDLLRVYTDAEDHLKQKEENALSTLSSYMKKFLEVQEERKKVSEKLVGLKLKLAHGAKECSGCGDDEEDESEDE